MTYKIGNKICSFSPIIIFCYRRKIDSLIVSLLKNTEASESDIFIFSDNYKSDIDKDVLAVRESLKYIKVLSQLQSMKQHIIKAWQGPLLMVYHL